MDGDVALTVVDPLFADNAGPLRLTVRDGTAAVDRGPGPAGATVAVSTLTSLVTGHLDAGAARHAGLLPGATDADVATLRRLFAGPPPTTVEFF